VATQLAKFRQDLEVIPRVVEGEGLRYILKDPQTAKIFAFRQEEYFICRQLDGQTPLPAVQDAFYRHFHISMELEQLEAFVRHLASLELLEYTLPPEEMPWHFPVYYKKHTLGNPDRVLQGLSFFFSWCFNRIFVICVGLLVLMGIIILVKYFSFYRYQVVNTLWKPGPFVLETLLGLFVVNMVGEFGKALALKHYGGNVPEVCVGLAYRLIPTFQFDISDLWTKKKAEQLKILSAGLVGQLLLWAVGMLAWRISAPWTNIHMFWVIFTVSAQFFFLINLIPLLPRDGYFLMGAWLEISDLFYRARGLVEAWVFRRPLPEPLTTRERLGFKVFGVLSIGFLVTFWMLVLGIIGYCLIWYWKLKGLGACLFLFILGLRYGDAMKQLARRLFSPRGNLLSQEGFIKNKLLFWLGALVILIIIFLIPYPFEAGGNFKILPINQLSIRAVVSGQIETVQVQEGQWVEKGQVLALLLDKDQKARMDSAKESLAAAQEKLNWMRIGPKPEEVAKAAQEVKLVAKALQYSSVEADRYTKMFREKSVSEEEYMNKMKARDEDRERLVLAQKNLALVKVPFRPEEIKAQEAEVRRLEAELALAEKNLQLTKILSPTEGRLITAYPLQKVGQYLDVGDLLGVIENARITIAEIEVPENDITQVKVGARVKLKTWALPTKTFTGKVTEIAPVGYDQNRHRVERALTEREFRSMQIIQDSDKVIRVLSEFPDTDGLLRTDMSGYAKIRGKWMPLGVAFTRWLMRLVLVEIWSWIP
jgi:putative peptide zinc metalloprotease protein